jgi:hypothetical protein
VPIQILLDLSERSALARHLPPRCDGHNWQLYYSTSADGFNLHTLYRRSKGVSGPALMLVADTKGNRFGAFLTDAPVRTTEHFTGTGETFVFR